MTFPETIGWTDVSAGVSAFLTGGVLLIVSASLGLRFVPKIMAALSSVIGGRR